MTHKGPHMHRPIPNFYITQNLMHVSKPNPHSENFYTTQIARLNPKVLNKSILTLYNTHAPTPYNKNYRDL